MLEQILEQIIGIGPKQAPIIAAALIAKYGNTAKRAKLPQIKKWLLEPPIVNRLTTETRIELQYEPLRQIPKVVIHVVADELIRVIGPMGCHGRYYYEICGGYKRGKKISHDVDILLCVKKGASSIDTLRTFSALVNSAAIPGRPHIFMYEPYQLGNSEASLLIDVYGSGQRKVTIKADILFAPPDELVFADLYLTGSAKFNINMRYIAHKNGYKLNQKGLFYRESGERVPIKNERDVFALLGMTYRKPEERN